MSRRLLRRPPPVAPRAAVAPALSPAARLGVGSLSLVVVATALALAPGTARADTVTVQRLDPQPFANVSLRLFGRSYSDLAGELTLTSGQSSFAAYCIELTQPAYLGSRANYSVSTVSSSALSRLFTVAGLDSGHMSTDRVDTAAEMVALQLAVWETVYDGLGGSLASGNFSVAGVSSSYATAWTLAQGYLQAAYQLTDTSLYAGSTLLRYANPSLQDFVAYTPAPPQVTPVSVVPEPQTALMLGAGLATVALVGWRRRRQPWVQGERT
ncbi:PEP-CTERM sorting domain-containing protein [Ideonella livida]|uniref:PEP-CTERM sorting domain-containing protein n=1 Tax=Ideonella livida TaxID=2707176 RepID=A0A7C9TPB4_9BURK|nr:PEP-CTERM sorting domain-containing protein [Ideonella livida]NDY93626.1 PEP-CTERM sorting domain-containing protein [Ideonella livida]